MVASLDGYERRPERDWLRIEAPDIRIVPPDLAAAADARLAGTRDVFARGPHGRLLSHPSRRDLVSPYLLAGTAYGVACGGALISQTRARTTRHVYSCVCHQKRGVTICTNSVRCRTSSWTARC